MREEDKELAQILETGEALPQNRPVRFVSGSFSEPTQVPKPIVGGYTQWSTSDNTKFYPATSTTEKLIPGVYEIDVCQTGPFLVKVNAKTEGLFRFKGTNVDEILQQIEKFWSSEELYKRYNLTYKLGILCWSDPGCGKSSTLQLISKDVVSRGGVVLKFGNPSDTVSMMRTVRKIQPDIPMVILMEDLDSTIEYYSESEILNILDGVEEVHKCLFLATTNFPQKLGPRIVNRPSRFDKRYKIGLPNRRCRKEYFEFLSKATDPIDLNKWADDTKGLSVAHLKELFVSVQILGNNYADTLSILMSMKSLPSSEEDKRVGFLNNTYNSLD